MNIHIKNVRLIPVTEENLIEEDVNIYIMDDEIFFIGESLEDFQADRTINGKNMLAMPGLVNAHTHVGMSVLRNFADDLPLHEWLEDAIWPVEAELTDEDIYWASLLSMAEMIESGTTTFNDMYFSMDKVAEGIELSGMRGALGRGLASGTDEENGEKIEEVRTFHENWNGRCDDRIRTFVSPHAIYTCDDGFLKDLSALSEELDIPIHIHLSETEKEEKDSREVNDKSATTHCKDLGIFDRPTIAAHCVHLNDEDLEIIKENEVRPVYNPTSNLKLASGFARIDEMIKMGIPVALGTDGSSSNNNLNMFEEMHIGSIVNKAVNMDATSLSAYDLIKMATINGAEALGWDSKIGSIEVGKKADIILIDLDKPHLCPRNNLISAVTYSIQGSDVDTVIVNGEILMENREHKTLDIDRIKEEVEKIEEKINNL